MNEFKSGRSSARVFKKKIIPANEIVQRSSSQKLEYVQFRPTTKQTSTSNLLNYIKWILVSSCLLRILQKPLSVLPMFSVQLKRKAQHLHSLYSTNTIKNTINKNLYSCRINLLKFHHQKNYSRKCKLMLGIISRSSVEIRLDLTCVWVCGCIIPSTTRRSINLPSHENYQLKTHQLRRFQLSN